MREWWQSIRTFFELIWVHRRRMIHRAAKDSRYRRVLLLALGTLLYVTVYAFYYARNPAAVFLLVLGVAVAAWIARRNGTEDATFPTLRSSPPISTPITPLTYYGQAETIALRWFLYRRALSELVLKQQTVAPDSVGTRAALLFEMRASGLDEHWSEEERDLHLSPDGAWTEDAAVNVIARAAEIEALLWACGALKKLLPIEDLQNVVVLPMKLPLPSTIKGRYSDEIRLEFQVAFSAWLRVAAEAHRRGLAVESVEYEFGTSLSEIAADGGNQNTDLVLGTKLVTEVNDSELGIARDQLGMRTSALSSLLGDSSTS